MNRIILFLSLTTIILGAVLLPASLIGARGGVAIGQTGSGLIPCDDIENCTFDKLFGFDNVSNSLFNKVLNFLVFGLAVPLATVGIVYAGALIANPASPGNKEEGKKILWNVIWGLIITLAAYLIIKTIVNALADPQVLKLSVNNTIF